MRVPLSGHQLSAEDEAHNATLRAERRIGWVHGLIFSIAVMTLFVLIRAIIYG